MEAQLLYNGRASLADPERADPWPVVKLFTPDAGCTWLATEIDREEPNRLWALADLGIGFCEYGAVWLPELLSLRRRLGLPVERDRGRLKSRFRLTSGHRAGDVSLTA